jgi:hypothetical protein
VSDREGGPPEHTVVTCPANWGDPPDAGDQAEVYVMAADGSGQRNVTDRPGLDVHPAWGTPAT